MHATIRKSPTTHNAYSKAFINIFVAFYLTHLIKHLNLQAQPTVLQYIRVAQSITVYVPQLYVTPSCLAILVFMTLLVIIHACMHDPLLMKMYSVHVGIHMTRRHDSKVMIYSHPVFIHNTFSDKCWGCMYMYMYM